MPFMDDGESGGNETSLWRAQMWCGCCVFAIPVDGLALSDPQLRLGIWVRDVDFNTDNMPGG